MRRNNWIRFWGMRMLGTAPTIPTHSSKNKSTFPGLLLPWSAAAS
jgi:hypothetical protein